MAVPQSDPSLNYGPAETGAQQNQGPSTHDLFRTFDHLFNVRFSPAYSHFRLSDILSTAAMSFVTDQDLSIPRPPEAANPTRLTVPTLGACTRAALETKVAPKKVGTPLPKAELALLKTKALPEKVQLLFELVEDSSNDQIISWSSNGDHFMVKDVKNLAGKPPIQARKRIYTDTEEGKCEARAKMKPGDCCWARRERA